jgi:hypothetical protein
LIEFKQYAGNQYIKLPDIINNKKATINIKNDDDMCFKYCILYELHKDDIKHHPERVSNYKKYENELNFDGINFPVKICDISKFEKQNNIAVNVYQLEIIQNYKINIFPLRITKLRNIKTINLLYVELENEINELKSHYVVISNFNGLLKFNKGRHNEYFCPYCMITFNDESKLNYHINVCSDLEHVKTELPLEGKNVI